MTNKGLLIIFTGEGKGKTTAALGQALRAAGHGFKTAFIQFIKGSWPTGESKAIKNLSDFIKFETLGRGFTWKSNDLQRDKALAQHAWQEAKKAINSGNYNLVVLDEFTYVLNYSMVELNEVIQTLKNRPYNIHVIITGRDAPKELVELADLVTEMKEIKHPYKKGIKAQKGIEF